VAAFVCAGLSLAGASVAGEGELVGRVRVTDGDTLRMGQVRIRIYGIDAPEMAQRCVASGATYLCGVEATKRLKALIGSQAVRCVRRDVDRYGRLVGVCYRGDLDLGREMVREGWAVAFAMYSGAYLAEEEQARKERRGVWRGPHIKPWEFRRSHPREGAYPARRAISWRSARVLAERHYSQTQAPRGASGPAGTAH